MALSGLGNNDFRILKKLSHRAQGRTYMAELLSTKDLFVMKKEEYLSDEDKARVQLQIEQMKRLTSKFTVRLVCSFQFDVDMCIVMELCENDLRKTIAQLQMLPEPERVTRVWAIVSQVIRSLDHLHTNNVVHQKIKPENIFVNADGSIRFGNFVGAQPLNEKDCLSLGSTMVYMAPEVWLMKRCDSFSNIFSCGVIAAELLTGKHPFYANNELAIVERIKKGSFDKLPAFVPYDLKELIESMIDADYSKRPTTRQIMIQSTIDTYLRIQLEKEKDFEVSQNRAKVQSKPQSSSIRVVSVPTVDEQVYQSYPAQPDPQYLQAVQQQHAYQQNQIPNQNQISTISSVPVLETVPSNPQSSSKKVYYIKKAKPKQNSEILKPAIKIQEEELEIYPVDSPVLADVHIHGNIYTHTQENENKCTILFNPAVNKGIVKLVIRNLHSIKAVGIVDEPFLFNQNEEPSTCIVVDNAGL
ncbi:MAG: putative serine/threonine-protein kinase Nek3 [Streblomastix strix]|uniref:non-specific serine/threonine protein kinase n=1 Tax=Streblomastix strix TaxID=222440 RepID=A0A5J4USR1_9EUKA|nr:MAG: putative serine/threonine-protein kinase Nek3 [Streblomastix strix]